MTYLGMKPYSGQWAVGEESLLKSDHTWRLSLYLYNGICPWSDYVSGHVSDRRRAKTGSLCIGQSVDKSRYLDPSEAAGQFWSTHTIISDQLYRPEA